MTPWTRRRVLGGLATAAAVVVAVVLGQVAVLLVAGRPLRGGWGWWPAVLAAAMSVIVYRPIRRALLVGVDRLLRRGPGSPEAVIEGFGDRVSRGVPIDDLLVELAEALRRNFHARRAEVWTAAGTRFERVVVVPEAAPLVVDLPPGELATLGRVGTAGEAWTTLWSPTFDAARRPGTAGPSGPPAVRLAPARHGGVVLGALLVERAAGDGPFTSRDDRAMGELGRRLGDLLRNRQLDRALRATLDDLRVANADLRASRARLVATADAERRRLERDLHDGAQQQLVALTLNLGLARDGVLADPAATVERLDRLADDARLAIDQLRELAHGIYPPMLMDLGLAGALGAIARRGPHVVTVDARGIGRRAADVEAAVYFCCLEALQNAAKHAPGAAVCITVADEADGALHVVVADDGPGFDPAAVSAGHGMQNMADRLGAVGGRLSVDAAPGAGTRIDGVIPS